MITKKDLIVPTKEFGYKQPKLRQFKYLTGKELIVFLMDRFDFTADEAIRMAVSYTHLTLPTKRIV